VVEQDDRPDKKVYEITAWGRETLASWVTEPAKPRAARDELVLKAYSVWMADQDKALGLFRDQQRAHEEQLRNYKELERWMRKEWGEDLETPESPLFATYATLQRGLAYERGYAEWCRWLADRLERRGGGNTKRQR
jgi:DNA-binding PadR family transcriptional regulator